MKIKSTWSRFQSDEVRDIVAHWTEAERESLVSRARFYGLWGALSFGIPFGFAVALRSALAIGIAVPLIIVHLIGIPIWIRKQKKFLCSTEWAKSQGYAPESLKMYRFRFW